MKPLIFISSVSRELKTARQLVANTLLALGYEPVWQDIFETSPDDLREMLRKKIDSCSAVLQIVGHAYGAEPPTPDETFGRCSYTQYEALYARLRGKPVYYLIAEDDLPRDAAAETIDTPREESDAAKADAAERQRLQSVYRQDVLTAEQVYYPVHNHQETELSVRRLRDDLAKLRRGFRYWMIGISAALVLITGGVGWNQWSQQQQRIEQERQAAETKRLLELEALNAQLQHERTTAQIAAAARKAEEDAQKAAADLAAIKAKQAEEQKITAAKIRAQLIESSEAVLKVELEQADKEPTYEKREQLKDSAKAANAARLSRIDDLAVSFAEIEQRSDSTDEFREMTRILTTEKVNAVEKALAYAEKHRAERFERVRARKLAEQEQSRAELQIDLKAASTAAASGQPAAARKLFEEILALEPNWPDVLDPYCWFLYDQSIQSEQHDTLQAAIVDAERCLELAERLIAFDSNRAGSERVLSAACDQMGVLLTTRGQPGDAEQALGYYRRCNEVLERLLQQNPDSAQAARDVSVSLEKLGGFLSTRGQPGDAERALGYYQRDLEISERLLQQNPDSAQAARDVMVSHYKLGELFVSRSDYGVAIPHFRNGIAVLDQMLEKKLSIEATQREKSVLESRLQFCQVAELATGDWETLLKADASILPQLLSIRVTLLAKKSQLSEVVQAGAKLRELEPKAGENLYSAARAYALCAGLLIKDKPTPTDAESAEQQSYIDLSLACLKEAINTGYSDFEQMRKDTDLSALQGLPEFEALFPLEEAK